MKKELRKKNNEPLHEWVSRIAPLCIDFDAQSIKEILLEVARQGYISGVRDTNDINLKH